MGENNTLTALKGCGIKKGQVSFLRVRTEVHCITPKHPGYHGCGQLRMRKCKKEQVYFASYTWVSLMLHIFNVI